MNCVELQQSLAEVEDGGSVEQNAHLRTCPGCSTLVAELNLIAATARQLQAADEPSPRVWNSIETALRQEGLIRPPRSAWPLAPWFSGRWSVARWLVPAAAMLLLSVGIYIRHEPQPSPPAQPAAQAAAAVPFANPVEIGDDLNDNDLMQEVSDNSPAMKTAYQENLREVNESIRDEQNLVDESPNDEEAERSLMDAYQQKSMLFELAMDRTLP
ncbi:MAG: anti-sigma factor [Candidatus Sulfotelmatobacter sp.]